jgi:hypothetical protein
MAEAAAADGVDTFDLGRGEHRYKDEIKSGELELAQGWLFAVTGGLGPSRGDRPPSPRPPPDQAPPQG